MVVELLCDINEVPDKCLVKGKNSKTFAWPMLRCFLQYGRYIENVLEVFQAWNIKMSKVYGIKITKIMNSKIKHK